MKRINIFILTIVLALIFLVVEIIIIKSASKYEPKIGVVFAARKIKAGETVTEDMLEERKISVSMAHSQSVKDKNEITGKKAKVDIEKDEIILASRITDSEDIGEIKVKDKNNRLFTVEFKSDQANGWQLKEDQYVDIIFIPNEKNIMPAMKQEISGKENNKGVDAQDMNLVPSITEDRIQRIRNIRVAALIDEKGRLVKNPENATIPRYISFEVDDKLDEFLAYAKGNGRLEISVIPAGE